MRAPRLSDRESLAGAIAPPARVNSIPLAWMGAAFALSLTLATIVLTTKGTAASGLVLALRVTARWSFLLFWLAYTGRAMNTLFGPTFAPIARRGRELGLAYASAMVIHVGLVVWLFHISSKAPLSGNLFIFFVVGIVWTYLLASLSFGNLAEPLGPRAWRVLRFAGLNYILLAFAYDFVPAVVRTRPSHYGVQLLVAYLPFAVMCIAAPLLVLAAAAHRLLRIPHLKRMTDAPRLKSSPSH